MLIEMARSEWSGLNGVIVPTLNVFTFVVILRLCKRVLVWGKYTLTYIEVINHAAAYSQMVQK